jgi:VanZ family protein
VEPPSVTPIFARTSLWRRLFWLYFAVLTVALLWPALQIPEVVPRPDLIVHGVAFGLFSLLLSLWNPLGLRSPWPVAVLGLAAGAAYGGITEALQMIPILKRTCALDDWLADVFGVACGLAVFGLTKVVFRAK